VTGRSLLRRVRRSKEKGKICFTFLRTNRPKGVEPDASERAGRMTGRWGACERETNQTLRFPFFNLSERKKGGKKEERRRKSGWGRLPNFMGMVR